MKWEIVLQSNKFSSKWWDGFSSKCLVFIKLENFDQCDKFSSKTCNFIKVINCHRSYFSSNWWIFIKVIDFQQKDELASSWCISIKLMYFHLSDKFSPTWWTFIKLINLNNIMSFHKRDNFYHGPLFSLKWSISVKVINVNQSNEMWSLGQMFTNLIKFHQICLHTNFNWFLLPRQGQAPTLIRLSLAQLSSACFPSYW